MPSPALGTAHFTDKGCGERKEKKKKRTRKSKTEAAVLQANLLLQGDMM